jgi:hypothetical protein
MARYGLGNFEYEVTVKDGAAHFDFYDPEDADNTAQVSVASKDFPEGVTQATSRQVADLAYSQCSKVLNDKRDARIKKQAAADLDAKLGEDARAREAGADFLNNANDVQTQPTKTDDDGTRVYNTGDPKDDSDTGSASDSSDKKSK